MQLFKINLKVLISYLAFVLIFLVTLGIFDTFAKIGKIRTVYICLRGTVSSYNFFSQFLPGSVKISLFRDLWKYLWSCLIMKTMKNRKILYLLTHPNEHTFQILKMLGHWWKWNLTARNKSRNILINYWCKICCATFWSWLCIQSFFTR